MITIKGTDNPEKIQLTVTLDRDLCLDFLRHYKFDTKEITHAIESSMDFDLWLDYQLSLK